MAGLAAGTNQALARAQQLGLIRTPQTGGGDGQGGGLAGKSPPVTVQRPQPRPAPVTPQPAPTPSQPSPAPVVAPNPAVPGGSPSTQAPVGSGAFIPPPMQTTPGAPGQGDVYSWNFPTHSANPTPEPTAPAAPTGDQGGGLAAGPTMGQQNAIGSFGSLNPAQRAALGKGLNLPKIDPNNPFVQSGNVSADAQPITPWILRNMGLLTGAPAEGGRAAGGGVMSEPGGPSNASMEKGVVKDAESTFHHSGLVHSTVAGRTDRLPVSVPAGAYVIPADVVSGLGEGNTLAGAKVLDRMMHSGPFGTTPMTSRGPDRMPGYPPAGPEKAMGGEVDGAPNLSGQLTMPPMPMPQAPGIIPGGIAPPMARGGNADDTGETVPIIIAGGEYVVHPDSVKMVGKGDLTKGHDHLDTFVKNVRSATAKKMQSLPGPKK